MIVQKRARAGLARHLDHKQLPSDGSVLGTPWLLSDGEIADLHRHDVLEIGYCHEGSGMFLVEDKVSRFTTGCATVVSAREFHRARSDPGTTSRWTFCFVDPHRLVGRVGDEGASLDATRLCGRAFANVLTPARHADLCALARLLASASTTHARRATQKGLVLALMAELNALPGRADPRGARGGSVERVAPALRLLAGDDQASVPRLAAACGLTPPRFRRVFNAAMGQPPKQYALRLRVERAAAMLRGGRAGVAAAALACGFAAPSSLYRHFERIYGHAPSVDRVRPGARRERAPR